MAERSSNEFAKDTAIQLEYGPNANASSEEKMEDTNVEYTAEEEKKVERKIDMRLIPIMLAVNSIQLLDKNSISQAATYGLIQQANLKGQEYSLLVALFYIGYLVAEYPTNYLMQKFPTGKYITINITLWGITLAAMASATNFATLAAARFFLGVFEACINPGFVMITSSWWKTEQQASRIGLWYSAAGVANILGGLMFYGIAFIDVPGWFPYQWMFLILGLFTTLLGICYWFFLPDSPQTASFLNERERLIAIARLRGAVKNTEHKREQVWEALTDPKVWLLTLGVFFQNMTNGMQGSFLGLILKGFGYNTYEAVLLSMPGGGILTVVILIISWFLTTKWGRDMRVILIMICYLPGIVSTAILYSVKVSDSTQGVLLFAIFFINIISCSAPLMYSLLASNVRGYTKKSVANTLFFVAYSLGNIISPQTFLEKEAPTYTTGIAVTLASFCVNIVNFGVLYAVYTWENMKRDKAEAAAPGEPLTEADEIRIAMSDMTDRENKTMRYSK